MKKVILVLMLLFCIVPKATAKEKYAALVFDGGPSVNYTRQLLEELKLRNAKATFFLRGVYLAEQPGIAGEILAGRHEIGLRTFHKGDLTAMSRRAIAKELMDTQALLPGNCRIRFFRPEDGSVTDGIRQVAKARRLAIVSGNGCSAAVVQPGDVLIFPDDSAENILVTMERIDLLRRQGFRFVTLSELARLHRVRIRAGEIFTVFPPPEEIK